MWSRIAATMAAVRPGPAGNSPFLIDTPCGIPGARNSLSEMSTSNCIMSRMQAYLYLPTSGPPNIVYTGFFEPSSIVMAWSFSRTIWNDAKTPTTCRLLRRALVTQAASHASRCAGVNVCLAAANLTLTCCTSQAAADVYSTPASLMVTVSPRSRLSNIVVCLNSARTSVTDFFETNSTHRPGLVHAARRAVLSVATHPLRMKWTPPFRSATHFSISRAQDAVNVGPRGVVRPRSTVKLATAAAIVRRSSACDLSFSSSLALAARQALCSPRRRLFSTSSRFTLPSACSRACFAISFSSSAAAAFPSASLASCSLAVASRAFCTASLAKSPSTTTV